MILKLAQMTVAMNAFERSSKGMRKVGMDSVTIASFMEELDEISSKEKRALDTAALRRISDKALSRGWSGARETKSIMRLTKAEGRLGAKKFPHLYGDAAETVRKAPSPTVVQRARPTPGTTSKRPPSNLRRNLALGGAVVGGMAAGNMMSHHPQQQQAYQ